MPDLTISLTAGQAQRVAAALGKHLQLTDTPPGPPYRDATVQEAEAFLLNTLKNLVKQEETKTAIEQVNITDL